MTIHTILNTGEITYNWQKLLLILLINDFTYNSKLKPIFNIKFINVISNVFRSIVVV